MWHELERRAHDQVVVAGVVVGRGSLVRLRPRTRRDNWDVRLTGRVGRVESVEEDGEGNLLIRVSPEDGPGGDPDGVRPGHRFFFAPDELEPLPTVRVLVAGIGNVLLGDDGFGCHVVARLAEEARMPPETALADFGVQGLDLAYALAGYDVAVLVDALPIGEPPGTLRVIEPQLEDGAASAETGIDPGKVLQLAHVLDTLPGRLLVVACQPERIGDPDTGDDHGSELSVPVAAAVSDAVRLVRELVAQLTAPETEA
jgi:hydrogenase maturation protease